MRKKVHELPVNGNGENPNALIPQQTLEQWEAEHAVLALQSIAPLIPATQRISIKGSVFRIGDLILGDTMDAIICGTSLYHAHFTKPFTPDENSKPDCWATSALDANGLPDNHEDALRPDPPVPHQYAELCKQCSLSKWGSKGKGIACPVRERVALLVLGGERCGMFTDPSLCIGGILDLSATARAVFGRLLTHLVITKTPPFAAVMRVSFDPNKKNWPSPVFVVAGRVQDEFRERVRQETEKAPGILTTPVYTASAVPPADGEGGGSLPGESLPE